MRLVIVVAVLVAMVCSASAVSTSNAAFLEALVGAPQKCGAQANNAKCPEGQCCGKYGFCGTTSFHCQTAKGCQSQCKEPQAAGTPQPVVPVTADSSSAETQIIVKTVSNAVPLCKNCNTGSEESSELSSAEESAALAAAREAIASDPVTVPAGCVKDDCPAGYHKAANKAATTTTTTTAESSEDSEDSAPPPDSEESSEESSDSQPSSAVDKEVKAIKEVQKEGEAKAKEIIQAAKEAAEDVKEEKKATVAAPNQDKPSGKGPLSAQVNVLDPTGY